MQAAIFRRSVFHKSKANAWQDVEIIGRHPSGAYVLREVGRVLPGVFLGRRDQVRIPGGTIERPAILPRKSRKLPPMTAQQRWKYRTIREACGRDEALRAVLGP